MVAPSQLLPTSYGIGKHAPDQFWPLSKNLIFASVRVSGSLILVEGRLNYWWNLGVSFDPWNLITKQEVEKEGRARTSESQVTALNWQGNESIFFDERGLLYIDFFTNSGR